MSVNLIENLRQRLAAGDNPSTTADIKQAVLARRSQRGEHREWGLLCEEAGLMSLAFSEFQLALRDDAEDSLAMFHLAQHYRERGNTERARTLLGKLVEKDPAREDWLETYVDILREDGAAPRAEEIIERAQRHGLAADAARRLRRTAPISADAVQREQAAATVGELDPSDADCFRFATLFSGREGIYARQWAKKDGQTGYTPVHEPLTPAVIRNHLLGTYTIGTYPIRLDGTATFFALDLDIDKSALQRARGDHGYAGELRETMRREGPRLLEVLRQLGLNALFENSGYKGRHYWVFLAEPEMADVLHLFGRLFAGSQTSLIPPGLHLEFFPKQARLTGKKLGNLIKLPLGIHRRTGYRSLLLDDLGQASSAPLAALRSVERTPRERLLAALDQLKRVASAAGPAGKTGPSQEDREAEPDSPEPPAGPAPPALPDVWTEADFEAEPRIRHLLEGCPVLAELKRSVEEHQRLSHEEQLVLIHSLGHLDGGPLAVNYLFDKCIDLGPEKRMKDRLKGNPVSCPSIRKKIPHITRRVACNCAFEWAQDRYPTPVLHLLTLPAQEDKPAGPAAVDPSLVRLAQRYGVLERRQAEIQRECEQLRDELVKALQAQPDRVVACETGRYRLKSQEGIEELVWEEDRADEDLATQTAEPPAESNAN